MADVKNAIESLDSETKKNVLEWMQFDEETKLAIEKLIEQDPKRLVDSFYTTLSFGTAGLRGVMGVGSNRMNDFTVGAATQGLANYLHSVFVNEPIAVAIGYDSRINSKHFAEVAASVLAGNDIHVFLFDTLHPTPLVSFACRYKGCKSAIMITASHNPPEYNGYKVYWSDGGQVLPPHDKGIVTEAARITSPKLIRKAPLSDSRIVLIGKEVDDAYLDSIEHLQLNKEEDRLHGKELKMLYSNLHGTGITIVPKALNRFGFTSLGYVEAQKEPDGTFPTTRFPNPEERQALEIGIKQLIDEKYDLLIATDPDCDRLGVVVRHNGDAVALTGNQIAAVCAHFLAPYVKEKKNPAFVKSIVTTELVRAIATKHHISCFDILPGFKYIAEKIRTWEQDHAHEFIFGGEESYGYLLGTHARDKDAAIASCLIAEIALSLKFKGKTLIDYLDDIYKEYGLYTEKVFSINFPDGKEGKEQQKQMMDNLRKNAPQSIAGYTIVKTEDVLQSSILPKADVLIFHLNEGGKIIIRPSGTEPKTKVYLMLQEIGHNDISLAKQALQEKVTKLEAAIRALLGS